MMQRYKNKLKNKNNLKRKFILFILYSKSISITLSINITSFLYYNYISYIIPNIMKIIEIITQPKLCKNCGNPIPINKKRNQFCCHSCSKAYKKEQPIKEYNKEPKLCKHCNTPLPYNKRFQTFCSFSCSASYNSQFKTTESINKQKQTLLKTLNEKKEKDKENLNKKLNELKGIDYFSLNDYQQKKFRKHFCRICGAKIGECKDPLVCKKFQLFKSLTKFGFNQSLIGTEKVIEEFYRIKEIIQEHYLKWNSNSKKLKEVFGYEGRPQEFHKILEALNIKSKNLSTAAIDSILNGTSKCLLSKTPYKQEWINTWDNKKVFIRSSYEKDYANFLNLNKIEYKVEELRIKYFDTIKEKERCAIPDFYLPATNEIVEIKSTWTLNIQNMKDKFKAYKELGYHPKLILEHKEVDLYSLPEN